MPERLLAPLRPRTLRDFLTFEGHAKAAMEALGRGPDLPDLWYEVPAYYKGLPDTVVGDGAEIPWPAYAEQLDYELELACVIGRPGRDIARRGRARPRLRLDAVERPLRARHPGPRAAAGHGPRQGQGLGRRQRARAPAW